MKLAEKKNRAHEDEVRRIQLSVGLLAGSLAILVYIPFDEFFITLKLMFFGVAAFSFAYLYVTAVHLKYIEPGRVPEIHLPERMRQFFFDWSVNGFGLTLPWFISLVVAYLLGWRGEKSLEGGLIVSSIILLFIVLLAAGITICRRMKGKKNI